ncbi:MAG: sugar ABC transporter permease [Aquiluna sp.]|nr:sugar ABC transporter permease [Aquiluna sp.]
MNKSKSRNMAQTMLLLPAVLPVIFFSVAPIGYGLFLAFTNARAGNNLQFEFTGLENFQRLMSDTPFLESLRIGIVWAVSVTLIGLFVSLFFAVLLNGDFPGRSFFRSLAVIPWAIPPVVIALMWLLVYEPTSGLLNAVLTESGAIDKNISWLIQPGFAMPAAILVGVWATIPQTTLVILAALQGVPRELEEAASIDRANVFGVFKVATWPSIKRIVYAIATLDFISAFNNFSIVFILTDGSPGGAIRLPAIFAYQQAFEFGDFGYASAVGVAMILVMSVSIALAFRVIARGGEKAND